MILIYHIDIDILYLDVADIFGTVNSISLFALLPHASRNSVRGISLQKVIIETYFLNSEEIRINNKPVYLKTTLLHESLLNTHDLLFVLYIVDSFRYFLNKINKTNRRFVETRTQSLFSTCFFLFFFFGGGGGGRKKIGY